MKHQRRLFIISIYIVLEFCMGVIAMVYSLCEWVSGGFVGVFEINENILSEQSLFYSFLIDILIILLIEG